MMSSRNKIIIGTIALAVVVGGGYWYWNAHKQNDVVVSSKSESKWGVSYDMKTVFAGDEDGGVTYPILKSGATKEVLESINKQIASSVFDATCFSDPNSLAAVDDLLTDYINHIPLYDGVDLGNKLVATSTVEQWSYETVRQYLIQDFGYWSYLNTTVDYATSSLLSLSVVYNFNCAGAYPSTGMFGLMFDLSTGKKVPFKDLFTNYERDKKAIGEIIVTYYIEQNPDMTECDYRKAWENGDLTADGIDGSITEKGIELLDFGFPHAFAACNPDGTTVVPWALLKSYVSLSLLKLNTNKI